MTSTDFSSHEEHILLNFLPQGNHFYVFTDVRILFYKKSWTRLIRHILIQKITEGSIYDVNVDTKKVVTQMSTNVNIGR